MTENVWVTESVAPGHPDKVADTIAEAINDFIVSIDPDSHVACEVIVNKNRVFVTGEFKTKNGHAFSDFEKEIPDLIRRVIREDVGYNEQSWTGLKNLEIVVELIQQSKEICDQVDTLEGGVGAGDCSTSYGWAGSSKDTFFFPVFQFFANSIMHEMARLGKSEKNDFSFAPDGKIQVYTRQGKIFKIVVCKQFLNYSFVKKNKKAIADSIRERIIDPLYERALKESGNYKLIFIPFGNGGPDADTGLTGRKLIVDNYGTFVRLGGGSFAGKDVSKTDKTLALFARFLAKNIVMKRIVKSIEIQISVHIGQQRSFDYNFVLSDESKREQVLSFMIPFQKWTLSDIIERLGLKKVKFQNFAGSGYFGFSEDTAPWESTWERLSEKLL